MPLKEGRSVNTCAAMIAQRASRKNLTKWHARCISMPPTGNDPKTVEKSTGTVSTGETDGFATV